MFKLRHRENSVVIATYLSKADEFSLVVVSVLFARARSLSSSPANIHIVNTIANVVAS